MFGSDILGVAIGLVMVFLLVSMMASAIREALEALLHTRAAYLERGIREILNDKNGVPDGLARAFYDHPLIASLTSHKYEPGAVTVHAPIFAVGRKFPSYIPAKNFALAIMDIAVRGKTTDAASGDPSSGVATLENIRANVIKLGNPAVQRVVLGAIDAAQGDLVQARLGIQDWFDSGMDRVSGWYKRSTSWILFWVGLVLAFTMNVDAVSVAHYLYSNKTQTELIVAHAEKVSSDPNFINSSFKESMAALDSLHLPIGWSGPTVSPIPWSGKFPFGAIPGWFLAAIAATVGAPFWFDLLNKFMVIRSTVKPHEKSPEESSEDRQQPKAKPVETDAQQAGTGTTTVQSGQFHADAAIAMARFMTSEGRSSSMPFDADSAEDACNIEMDPERTTAAITITRDEDLPAAEGGVAQ